MTQANTSDLPSNSRLVLHDSEVSTIATHGNNVVISFSAAVVHGSAGLSGANVPRGYMPSVALVCLGVEHMQADAACMGRLSGGVLSINGQRLGTLPMPVDSADACTLELEFANGSRVTLRASGMHLQLSDGSRFIESYAC